MAMHEACQVWIEQRVKEELDAKGDTGASLREIGRMIASEVEKVFEAKVNPETMASKVKRAAGSIEPKEPTTQNNTEKSCSSCSKRSRLDPGEVMREVEAVIKEKRVTVNQAAKEVGVKMGRSASTVRGVYIRERDRTKARMGAGCADQFVRLAISQLERIDREYHEGWLEAIERLEAWIRNFKGGAK